MRLEVGRKYLDKTTLFQVISEDENNYYYQFVMPDGNLEYMVNVLSKELTQGATNYSPELIIEEEK